MYAFFIFILYIRIERQGCVTFASGLRQECVRGMQRLWLVFFPDLLEAIF